MSANTFGLLGWLDDPETERGVRFLDSRREWQRYTYADLAALVNGAAARLLDAGLRRDDVVPIVVPTGPEFVASFFGVLAAGGTPAVLPLPWALQDPDGHSAHLAGIAAAVRPRLAIASADHRHTLAGAESLTILEPALVAEHETVRRAPAELALLQFTSGSRGRPRGVRLPWPSLQANIAMIQDWTGITTHGAVSWLPLYHDMGLIGGLLSTLTKQVEQAMMRPEHFVRSPAAWLREYGTGAYPSMCMPNFGFDRVARMVRPHHLEGTDFSHISVVISGAERIDPAVLARWLELLEPFGFRARALAPAYGLAEATLAVTGVRRHETPTMVRVDGVERELGQPVKILEEAPVGTGTVAQASAWHVGCGRPLDGMEVRLVDDDDAVLDDDVLGEILVRGPSLAVGYTGPADADSPFADGWLRTGDAAFRHGGELFVVGRLGDRVKIHGRAVFVEDIEIALHSFGWADPLRLAVVGGVAGGRPTIVVIVERDYSGHVDLITDVVREYTGPDADVAVRRVRRGGIPVTSSGKPKRKVAWTRYLTGALGGVDLRDETTGTTEPAETSETAAPRAADGGRLFDQGLFGPHVDAFRAEVRARLDEHVVPHLARAEHDGLFPVAAIRGLGAAGLIRRRWNSAPHGDPGAGVVIAQEAARLGVIGVSVGLSLHIETVASALLRFGTTPLLRGYLEGVLDGRLIGCLGASEPAGGSDLAGITTQARRVPGGWHVTGEKKYLSLGLVCDFALILARITDDDGTAGLLGLFAIPAGGLSVHKRHDKLGTSSLDTTWMRIDAVVGDDAVLAKPGLGLLATTWALSHERLAVAAQASGGCAKAIGLAVAHLRNRTQFGSTLFEHQALRLRIAELDSRLTMLEYAVYAAAAGLPVTGGCGPRELAGLKVTAARFAEEVMSECMHLFGGAGYLVDETPLGRMWRDARLARLGAGSDEMMWELVAGGLVADEAAYAESVHLG